MGQRLVDRASTQRGVAAREGEGGLARAHVLRPGEDRGGHKADACFLMFPLEVCRADGRQRRDRDMQKPGLGRGQELVGDRGRGGVVRDAAHHSRRPRDDVGDGRHSHGVFERLRSMSIKDNQRCLRELLAQRAPQVAEPYEAQLCHLCCLLEFSYGWIRNRARHAQALSSRQQSTQPPLGAQPPSLLVSYRPLA